MGEPRFAHDSERAFAELLTFYGLRWEYEPTTFVLETDGDGNPTLAVTPDFHLPDHDVYIELTTMRQQHVTRKNRKIRRLRERYADIDVRILYAADIDELRAKYDLRIDFAAA